MYLRWAYRYCVSGAEDGDRNRRKRGKDVEVGEAEEDEDDEEGGDEEGADAEKRRGQDNDERGYDDDVDDAEEEIAEKTKETDLQEQVWFVLVVDVGCFRIKDWFG